MYQALNALVLYGIIANFLKKAKLQDTLKRLG